MLDSAADTVPEASTGFAAVRSTALGAVAAAADFASGVLADVAAVPFTINKSAVSQRTL